MTKNINLLDGFHAGHLLHLQTPHSESEISLDVNQSVVDMMIPGKEV